MTYDSKWFWTVYFIIFKIAAGDNYEHEIQAFKAFHLKSQSYSV